MDALTKKAIERNGLAIMTLISACGPQTIDEIHAECIRQADERIDIVMSALDELVRQGALFCDIDNDEPVWDEPCIPWPSPLP